MLLTGARQTGKTFAIRRFGAENFDSIVEINFVESRNAIGFLDGAVDAKEMILRISALAKTKMIPGKTLIFFDEVQEYPEIVTLIKFLVEEGSYRYALSGSLLGVELKDLRSEPVGYMDIFDMYPLDFEEFSLAVGVALPTYNVEEPKYPLKLAEQSNLFKLFLNDVGLLTCQYSDGLQLKLLRGEMNVNYGGIFENAAAQELTAHGFSLAYFNNKKHGELDFVVTYKEKILPIEIKSGKNNGRHSAITRAPARRRTEPMTVFQVRVSPRNMTAKIMVSTRLHLSIGTTLETSPILIA